MNKLKDALIEIDESLNNLKDAILEKDTLHISEDEYTVYKSINKKYSDIIKLLNYMGANQNELCTKTRKDTFKD